mmetsp:Transcript_36369/g.76356  ORF Transcript_36369/g.76356 Transcript_36369/m.76356 type:complete len:222 (-) Transcript_36369:75-740(-)
MFLVPQVKCRMASPPSPSYSYLLPLLLPDYSARFLTYGKAFRQFRHRRRRRRRCNTTTTFTTTTTTLPTRHHDTSKLLYRSTKTVFSRIRSLPMRISQTRQTYTTTIRAIIISTVHDASETTTLPNPKERITVIRYQPIHSLTTMHYPRTIILRRLGEYIVNDIDVHLLCIIMHFQCYRCPREQLHSARWMTIEAVVFVMSIEGGVGALDFYECFFEEADP